ncbi:MAG: winged helix-turn-helix domain-containing protein [Anaerolineales bacterium]|nr:winged helix-turn-helix domain-containing protein [Anaerolineales bacterium]
MLPTTEKLLLPLLEFLGDGDEHKLKECVIHLRKKLLLPPNLFYELQPSGVQTKFEKRVGWAMFYLKKAKFAKRTGHGKVVITEKGLKLLANNIDDLRLRDLKL